MKIGVDEAGRGSVIGPLVVCAFASISQTHLKELGVKDSKDLSKKKRDELFDILSEMPHNVVICSPERIDNSLNLNDLEVDLFAEALAIMPEGEIMLDACDVNADRFARNVSSKSNLNCIAEHKADENHPEVSAASIIAKVTRDRAVEQLSEEIGIDLKKDGLFLGQFSDYRPINPKSNHLIVSPYIFFLKNPTVKINLNQEEVVDTVWIDLKILLEL